MSSPPQKKNQPKFCTLGIINKNVLNCKIELLIVYEFIVKSKKCNFN